MGYGGYKDDVFRRDYFAYSNDILSLRYAVN